jgi:hypothetical protein
MKQTKVIFLVLTILILTITSYASKYEKVLSTSCEYSNFSVMYKSDDKAIIEVNSNQIYVLAKIKKTNQNTEEFMLLKPEDLGRGGIMLNWNDFSKTKSILTIKTNNHKKIAFWHGFFDNNQSIYVWKKDTDLILEGEQGPEENSYLLYDCAFE